MNFEFTRQNDTDEKSKDFKEMPRYNSRYDTESVIELILEELGTDSDQQDIGLNQGTIESDDCQITEPFLEKPSPAVRGNLMLN